MFTRQFVIDDRLVMWDIRRGTSLRRLRNDGVSKATVDRAGEFKSLGNITCKPISFHMKAPVFI